MKRVQYPRLKSDADKFNGPRQSGCLSRDRALQPRNLTALQLTRRAAVIRLLNARLRSARRRSARRQSVGSRQIKFQRNYSDAAGNKDAADLPSYICARFHFALSFSSPISPRPPRSFSPFSFFSRHRRRARCPRGGR